MHAVVRSTLQVVIRIAAVVIALGLVAQPLVAVASAGWEAASRCCCPDLEHCRCPHGEGADHAPMLRRCGDAGSMIAPATIECVVPPRPAVLIAPDRTIPLVRETIREPDPVWPEVVTPPF